ncbi:MAG: hypothetical protein ACI9S8_000707 [Chlamydiales bacterium]|jgi:hypothetical protein
MLQESSSSSESFSVREFSVYQGEGSTLNSTRSGRFWQCICPGIFERNLSNKIKIVLGTTLAAVGVGCAVGFLADCVGMEEEKAILAGTISGIASGIFTAIGLRMRSLRAGEGFIGRGDESFSILLRNSFRSGQRDYPLLQFDDEYPIVQGDSRVVL